MPKCCCSSSWSSAVIGVALLAGIAVFGLERSGGDKSPTLAQAPETAAPPALASLPALLDGQEKSFLIVGYSTSFAWPAMLQDMLDEHAGVTDPASRSRVYHVLNATIGGAAVERWIGEPGSRNYEPTVGAMLRDFFGPDARLRVEAPEPLVALCQESLQFTRTLRGPIARADDLEGIKIGADALEKLAVVLHEQGIEHVIYGMHIYKKPVEPEVGNERFALKALLSRGHGFIHEGPDVWSLTIQEWPEAFTEDEIHPNTRGMKIMAEAWYRTLAGDDAHEEVIARMREREYDVQTMMRDYLDWRRGG